MQIVKKIRKIIPNCGSVKIGLNLNTGITDFQGMLPWKILKSFFEIGEIAMLLYLDPNIRKIEKRGNIILLVTQSFRVKSRKSSLNAYDRTRP